MEFKSSLDYARLLLFWCCQEWINGYGCDCDGTLRWRHNDYDGVSNHQPHGCLLNRLFTRKSKKTSKLRVTGLCVGNSPGPVNSPHKGPVTRKMFPFDDVIMIYTFVVSVVASPQNMTKHDSAYCGLGLLWQHSKFRITLLNKWQYLLFFELCWISDNIYCFCDYLVE